MDGGQRATLSQCLISALFVVISYCLPLCTPGSLSPELLGIFLPLPLIHWQESQDDTYLLLCLDSGGFWDLNSESQACKASTVPTEPSPQIQLCSFLWTVLDILVSWCYLWFWIPRLSLLPVSSLELQVGCVYSSAPTMIGPYVTISILTTHF